MKGVNSDEVGGFIGFFNLAIYPNQVLQFWDNVVV
jgi:hypothetical protein